MSERGRGGVEDLVASSSSSSIALASRSIPLATTTSICLVSRTSICIERTYDGGSDKR